MYIMTEDNKILNLNHYFQIGIYPRNGTYKLQASYLSGDTDLKDDIASFETLEKAEWVLRDLFTSMREKRTWDVRGFKQTEDITAGL